MAVEGRGTRAPTICGVPKARSSIPVAATDQAIAPLQAAISCAGGRTGDGPALATEAVASDLGNCFPVMVPEVIAHSQSPPPRRPRKSRIRSYGTTLRSVPYLRDSTDQQGRSRCRQGPWREARGLPGAGQGRRRMPPTPAPFGRGWRMIVPKPWRPSSPASILRAPYPSGPLLRHWRPKGVPTVTGKGHWTAAGVARVRERLGR